MPTRQNKSSKHSSHNSSHRSASSFLGRHNNRCMCQVCTCHKPSHQCPINYIKPTIPNKTEFQREYVPQNTKKPDKFRLLDNLTTGKKFMRPDGTEYQNAYKKKPLEKDAFRKNKDYKNVIVQNNIRGHLKNVMGNYDKDRQERPKSANQRHDTAFYQPQKFVKQDQYKPYREKFKDKTTYQKDYDPKNGKHKPQKPIKYDNLFVGNPDARFNKKTAYQQDHSPNKMPTRDNFAYNLIKQQHQYTHPINGDRPMAKQTEYQKEYKRKQKPHRDTCPINVMPRVETKLLKNARHIFYNRKKNDWV